jgi:lipoprotein-anchoring transpeptidase ErfK/SrfK
MMFASLAATSAGLFTFKYGARAALATTLLVLAAGAANARETVPFNAGVEPGTIIVRTSQRRLYFVVEKGTAVAYQVAVGKSGKQWFGRVVVDGKHLKPAWVPPAEVRKDNPKLPDVIPGGAPSNPMGAAALTLSGDKYAIHGTNRPNSIGTAVSYGCIRMRNEDVTDLFERVSVGTTVVVER